jgi:hypothetical protein
MNIIKIIMIDFHLELRNLYPSPSIITMIKSRRMRWAGHVEQMNDKRNAYRILVGNPEETTRKTKKQVGVQY